MSQVWGLNLAAYLDVFYFDDRAQGGKAGWYVMAFITLTGKDKPFDKMNSAVNTMDNIWPHDASKLTVILAVGNRPYKLTADKCQQPVMHDLCHAFLMKDSADADPVVINRGLSM